MWFFLVQRHTHETFRLNCTVHGARKYRSDRKCMYMIGLLDTNFHYRLHLASIIAVILLQGEHSK